MQKARYRRACLCSDAAYGGILSIFDRAAILKAIEQKPVWIVKARYWNGSMSSSNFIGHLLRCDKEYWTEIAMGDFYYPEREVELFKAGLNHQLTRQELLPFVAHEDPEVRTLGLRLMTEAKRYPTRCQLREPTFADTVSQRKTR